MNRDIIRMARESGAKDWQKINSDVEYLMSADALKEFAALVAAATAKEYEERLRFTQERWEIECKSQVEIEREELKKLDWTALLRDGGLVTWGDAAELGDRVIAAIQARGAI